ncbi:MAG: hypothetical protein JNL58_09540 [Planctomyces sp.]|nr:hypothetical protein [Planctomyces sp.]
MKSVREVLKTGWKMVAGNRKRKGLRGLSGGAESCEMRCLLSALGTAPTLDEVLVRPGVITGLINDNSEGNFYSVDIDIHNDGTVDHTLSAPFHPIFGTNEWSFQFVPGQFGVDDVNVGLTPRESNGVESHTGAKMVVTIPGVPNDPPTFVHLTVTESRIFGAIDDDKLNEGFYSIEAAIGSIENGFQQIGPVVQLGQFDLTHSFGYNDGSVPVFVRIRENQIYQQLFSNTETRYYTFNGPGGNPGGSPGGSPGSGPGGGSLFGGGGVGGLGGIGGGGSLFGDDDNQPGLLF